MFKLATGLIIIAVLVLAVWIASLFIRKLASWLEKEKKDV